MASAQNFAISDASFIGTPCSGAVVNDPAGDVTRDHRDIIGDATRAALAFVDDGTYLYARMRVTDSPVAQNKTTICTNGTKQIKPFGWGILLDVDGDASNYELQILLKGTGNDAEQQVYLRTNGANRVANPSSVSDSVVDSPDNPSDVTQCPVGKTCQWQFNPCTYGHVKTTGTDIDANGSPDWFVTFAIPISTLITAINQIPGQNRSAPLTGSLGLWGGTSNSGSTLDTDNTCYSNSGNTSPALTATQGDVLYVGTFVSITSPASGATLTSATPTISGDSETGAGVTVTISDGTHSGSATRAASTGLWSFAVPANWGFTHGSTPTITATASDGTNTAVKSVAVTISTCSNASRDGAETDIDCGGGSCAACANGKMCSASSDCAGGMCSSGLCQVSGCNNGVMDGTETAIDCGGASCSPCAVSQACNVGGDCVTGVCLTGTCQAPTCSDGLMNGSEAAVDCGNACPSRCATGQSCIAANDCSSGICTGNLCQAPTCSDNVRNGTETDVDCGGACPLDCGTGNGCSAAGDCVSAVCTTGTCRAATCTDGVENGSESDQDCGGSCPVTCANGASCAGPSDCTSGVCFGGVCQV
ncbi:MAG: hypothetical protein ABW321_18100, partial [Polyangiales bacterium]